jgi:hypothetical protein
MTLLPKQKREYLKKVGMSEDEIRQIELRADPESKAAYDLPIVEKGVRPPINWRLPQAIGINTRQVKGERQPGGLTSILLAPPKRRPAPAPWEPIDELMAKPAERKSLKDVRRLAERVSDRAIGIVQLLGIK